MSATKYILGELVGTGGMGTVHRAVAEGRPDPVAIKQLRPELVAVPQIVHRFETELRVGQLLTHPNIVRLVDYGDTPAGPPFLAMAWATGESLRTRIARTGATTEHEAVAIVTQLLDALGYAHDHGVAHGDIKSDNLLVDGDGETVAVTLIDWGLARFLDEPAARATEFVAGTPGYMAPEILQGEPANPRSDLYGVGVVLYELLTGGGPFGGGSRTQITSRQLLHEIEPPSLRVPGRPITASLERAVIRSLARNPADRDANARELAEAIALPHVHHPGHELLSSTTTLDWVPPPRETPLRLALGTTTASATEEVIATACLTSVSALLEARRLREAARELQRAVAQITAPDALWPLMLSLAAVHSGLGERDDAIRVAEEAREQSRRAGATIGERRAEAFLRRMSR